jgi:hypothetical protein
MLWKGGTGGDRGVGWSEAEEEVTSPNWEQHARKLREALKAKEKLLASYRLGRSPSEKTWRELDAANAAVEAFDAEVGQ